jgi:hypothetical protein
MVMLDCQTVKAVAAGRGSTRRAASTAAPFGAKRTVLIDHLGLPVAHRAARRTCPTVLVYAMSPSGSLMRGCR